MQLNRLLAWITMTASLTLHAQLDTSLFSINDDDLFSMKVKSASGIDESYLDAPSSMVVISEQDIRNRAYTSLDEILMDLPGFDVSVSNGTSYLQAYQRGYRTPFTQRTLIMVNGKVDNHLWSHMANISRQYPVMNIERVEVLYGPASAIYGPNAFLGVINIITKDGRDLTDGENVFESSIQGGSNNTYSADVFSAGKTGKISYSLGFKSFRSDEEDLSSRYNMISNSLIGDSSIWGPILNESNKGNNYGEYADPSDNWGLNGQINFGNFTFGTNNWVRKEGYGPYYAGDKAQPGDTWNYSSNQFYLDHNGEVNDKFKITTSINLRQNRIWGKWTEATPMWNSTIHAFDGDTLTLDDYGIDPSTYADYSFISSTNWHSISNATRVNQNYNYKHSDNFSINGGIKVEIKQLTKAYDIPGYWGVFSSVNEGMGPHNQGAAIGHSLDESYTFGSMPTMEMPAQNLIYTEDLGGFLQSIYDYKSMRFQAGLRYDRNSIYGESFNPRLSAVYKLPEENGAIKLSYGEAFQEPAPIQLFGGWNGRAANENLLPEKARNLELIGMYQMRKLFQQIAIYSANYSNVIKEEAENAGARNIFGFEYTLRGKLNNPLSDKAIDLYGFYTFTQTTSEKSYDFNTGEWVDVEAEVGDIAPHKIQGGLNIPLGKVFNLNLRGQYISAQTPYLRNQLRADENYKIPAYFNADGNLNANFENFTFGIKARNIFDVKFFYSGPEGGTAGTDNSQRSLGFHNSLIPNASRSFLIFLNYKI